MIISFDSRKKSFPAYVLPICYGGLALLFRDRWQYCLGLVLALVLFLGCYGLGKRLSFLIFKTADQALYFPFGLGILLASAYAVARFTTAPPFFYFLWGTLAVLSAFEAPVLTYRISRPYLWAAPVVLLGFWNSLTPATDFEAVSYHLGLSHQYLAIGKMILIPHQLFSSFPPFGQVLNLIFAGMKCESGIQAFSILLYIQIVSILVALLRWLLTEPVIGGGNGKDQQFQIDWMYLSRTELMVVPMLLIPSIWILIHSLTPDLLASLFFCAGISTLVKEFDFLSARKLFNIALLLAFALWTKYSILLYIGLLFVLWLSLSREKFSLDTWKNLGIVLGISLILWLPLLIRNTLALGDPLYPSLAGIVADKDWSPAQSLAFEQDVMPGKATGVSEIFLTPLRIFIQPSHYGSGGEIGLVTLLTLVLYPFARKLRIVNRILLYVFVCYVLWLYTFHSFSQFLSPFLLMFLASYFSFRHLYLRSPKYLTASWAVCLLVSLYFLIPFLRAYPPIRPDQTQTEYLRGHLDYFPLAERIGGGEPEKILLLADARIAYYRVPLIASGIYDQNPWIEALLKMKDPHQISQRLRAEGIRYIVLGGNSSDALLLQDALARSAKLVQKSGDVALYRIEESDAW